MKKVLQYIVENIGSGKIDKPVAVKLIKMLKQEHFKETDDIAIVGMAAKFPMADDVGTFWNNIRNGTDCVSQFPELRKRDTDFFLKNVSNAKEPIEYDDGAYIEDISSFDYKFFRLSPKEASLMDPNQRLFLQTACQAIEDAGYGGANLIGSKTGVFVGFSSDFGESYRRFIQIADPSSSGLAVPGNIKSIIASRISYLFDFKGPSVVVDTACSSSLVGVHMACQSINRGECEMAIAGGVKLNLLPIKSTAQEKLGIESNDGRTRTFDDSSSGTGFGEGVAVVLLKPLIKAIEDKDVIHAVIKGSAINQDGNSIGITAPNSMAQRDVLLAAWKNAEIDPETISYLEAHGTGTKLGDPLEVEGIEMAFRKYTHKKQFCAIGSVKTNIGHLDNAAGIAGLIKSVLALKNREIPPSIHFQKPNKKIDFYNSPVYVNDRLRIWDTTIYPRRCGLSSFGLSGTNCHIVLEEGSSDQVIRRKEPDTMQVLALSAKSLEALEKMVCNYCEFVLARPEEDIRDLCYSANTGRGHYEFRLAIIVNDMAELKEKLLALRSMGLEKNSGKNIYYAHHEVLLDKKQKTTEGQIAEEEKKLKNNEINMKTSELFSNSERLPNETDILSQICRLYVTGGDVDWNRLYKGQVVRKISLPVYPFDKLSCWIDIKVQEGMKNDAPAQVEGAFSTLVDKLVLESINHEVYSTAFSVDKHWVLNEHKVNGSYVVPGTTYLEIVMEICRRKFGDKVIKLENVVFVSPLIVEESEVREAQSIIINKGQFCEFIITSRLESNQIWVKHAEGQITTEDIGTIPQMNIDELKQICSEKIVKPESVNKGIVEVGPRWDNIKEIYIGDKQLLACLELPEKFKTDIQQYIIHPSMMDCAVNIAIRGVGKGLYLPWSYKSLKIYGSMEGEIYSYIKSKNKNIENAETATFDILLMNQDKKVFLEVEDYVIKMVHEKELKFGHYSRKENIYYKFNWIPRELKDIKHTLTSEVILFLKDQSGFSNQIIERLYHSASIIEVNIGEEYQRVNEKTYFISDVQEDYVRLIEDVKDKNITRIVHLFSTKDKTEIEDISCLEAAQAKGLYSLFYLTKALIANKIQKQVNIILVSDYVNEVTGDEEVFKPHNATLFGLAKVVGQEYENLKCRCIDIDNYTTAENIISEIFTSDDMEKAAYRRGIRYVEEFGFADIEHVEERRIEFKNQGVYIITGGTGGIGLEIGKFLSSKQKLNLALISRLGVPNREQWEQILKKGEDEKKIRVINTISEIEARGTEVTCYSANIANEDEVKPIIEVLRRRHGKINGVIHCAGIAADGIIINKDDLAFRSVILPKLHGTWIIDKLTKYDDLDFFCMFSSVTSFLGGLGQGNYAAANAFMDSFSAYRSKLGKETATINWSPWSQVGMAVDNGLREDGIFKPISTFRAVQSFGEVLGKKLSRIIVGEVDYDKIASLNKSLNIELSTDIKSIIEKKKNILKAKENNQSKGRKSSFVINTEDKSDEIEVIIANAWAEVLGLQEINIHDNFSDIGGDSALAIHLLRKIEEKIPDQIDVTDIFTYPTIYELSRYIKGKTLNESNDDTDDKTSKDMHIEKIMSLLSIGEISINEAENLIRNLDIDNNLNLSYLGGDINEIDQRNNI